MPVPHSMLTHIMPGTPTVARGAIPVGAYLIHEVRIGGALFTHPALRQHAGKADGAVLDIGFVIAAKVVQQSGEGFLEGTVALMGFFMLMVVMIFLGVDQHHTECAAALEAGDPALHECLIRRDAVFVCFLVCDQVAGITVIKTEHRYTSTKANAGE
ncbi:MAG: hypothetical protein HC828_06155 [Blastochloris sp.]|nr:hypothetical protein [Blastochloris sp.]